MSKKCDWKVRLANGTSKTVRAASKRMAQAEAVLVANEAKSAVLEIWKAGSTKNGNKPRNPNRPMPFPKGHHEQLHWWHGRRAPESW